MLTFDILVVKRALFIAKIVMLSMFGIARTFCSSRTRNWRTRASVRRGERKAVGW